MVSAAVLDPIPAPRTTRAGPDGSRYAGVQFCQVSVLHLPRLVARIAIRLPSRRHAGPPQPSFPLLARLRQSEGNRPVPRAFATILGDRQFFNRTQAHRQSDKSGQTSYTPTREIQALFPQFLQAHLFPTSLELYHQNTTLPRPSYYG